MEGLFLKCRSNGDGKEPWKWRRKGEAYGGSFKTMDELDDAR